MEDLIFSINGKSVSPTRINSDASKVKIKKLFDQVKERCPVNDNLANPTTVSFSM